jgi:hypothetical protein
VPLLGILKSQASNSSKDALIVTPQAPIYTSHTTYSQTNSKLNKAAKTQIPTHVLPEFKNPN